jgi:hypothetical protein
MLRRASRYLTASVVLVLPCFWQSRIQAGDLSSHIYNAWLATLIEQGRATGLYLKPQWTNTLFDLALIQLWRLAGPGAAQRIAVSCSVLLLCWGIFAVASAASRRQPWFLMPVIAMLAYGWVFHMGFCNYYLSIGLSLWAIALSYDRPGAVRIAATVFVLAIAWTAHAIPVAWAAASIALIYAARQIRPRYLPILTLVGVGFLVALHFYLGAHFQLRWPSNRTFAPSGLGEFLVFGPKYLLVAGAMLFFGILLSYRLINDRGFVRTLLGVPFQLLVCAVAAVLLMPDGIQLPGYHAPLTFLTGRLSLLVALSICVLFGTLRPGPWLKSAIYVVACVFFSFLYMDERAVNAVEDRMDAALSGLKADQRVVLAHMGVSWLMDPYTHMIDRACINHCFSYANYEPSSAAFRVRVEKGSPLVTANYDDSMAMQKGVYQVRETDLPMLSLSACPKRPRDFCLSRLSAAR